MALVVTVCLCSPSARGQLDDQLRWVDHIDENNMDIFFDRIVAVVHTKGTATVTASGVILNEEYILTSYNPFRSYVREGSGTKNQFQIYAVSERTIMDWKNASYKFDKFQVDTGRQVFPTTDQGNIWHFKAGEQSPLHDLMVLKVTKDIVIRNETDSDFYSFSKYTKVETGSTRDAGPIRTYLANITDDLGYDVKFASFGHIDEKHIKNGTQLRSHEYSAAQRVVTDCDEWLPRQWGRFICLRNEEQFKGIASGAMLFHRNLLYGVGNFLLSKGDNKSILVFTDVRPYKNLIYKTRFN